MYNLTRFIEDLLLSGYQIQFLHVGKGVFTEVTVRTLKVEFMIRVPSNYLRDHSKLRTLKTDLIEGIISQEKLGDKYPKMSRTLENLSKK